MTITLNGTTGIDTPAVTNNGAYTGDGISFADGTPSNTLVTNTSGNVGIGVTSPNEKLEVSTTGATAVRITGGDSNSQQVKFYSATQQNAAIYSYYNAGSPYLALINNGNERMRIDSSGNLLVGTTASGYQNANSVSLQTGAGNGVVVAQHANGTASGTKYAVFAYNAGEIGSISQNGTTAVAYNTTSDYRLKTEVNSISNALSTVAQLNPVNFTWIDGRADNGFIAHELQAVLPNVVTGEKDAVNEDGSPKYQQVDYSKIVTVLTAAIQEQQAIITEQSLALQDLKARIETLENM